MRTKSISNFLENYTSVLLIIPMAITLQSCNEDTSKTDTANSGLKIGQAEIE